MRSGSSGWACSPGELAPGWGGQAFGVVGAVLGFVALLLTAKSVLVAVFLDRFLSRVLRSSIRVRPSRSDVSSDSRAHVDRLKDLGFVVGETLVVVDDDDRVLGGPYAMLTHPAEPMAGWVGPVNITTGSELPDGRLLLTTNQPHVPSETVIAQVFGGKKADALLRHHQEGLSQHAPDQSARRADPQHMLVADEQCERTYFNGMSGFERVRALLRLTRQDPLPH